MREKVEQWVTAQSSSILNTFHDLHAIPELSWKEYKTSAYLRQRLDEMKLPYQTFDDHEGLVVKWQGNNSNGNKRVVGLRADLDALWQRTTDGWKAVHSCGHDAHMTMVLYAVKCLRDIGFEPNGSLKVIFQPAEESGFGARKLADQGVIDDIDCLLGIHVRSIHEMPDGHASAAIYNGSNARIEGRITGKAAHAARAHLGVNAGDVLAAIVLAVNSIKMNALIPSSAKVTIMRTEGTEPNIIPDIGYINFDLRAQTNDIMEELIAKVSQAISNAGRSFGAEVEDILTLRAPAAIPDPWMEELVTDSIKQWQGISLYQPKWSAGGEDFHIYKYHKPELRATMVGLGCGLTPGLHVPEMTFNLDALQNGIKILALSAIRMFEKPFE